MKDSFLSFYTTARKARFFAYAGFALIACCYIAINSLLLHRAEREVSYEVIWLLASFVAAAPVVYHFIEQAKNEVFWNARKPMMERLEYEVSQRGRKYAEAQKYALRRLHQHSRLRLLLAEDQETIAFLRIVLKERGVEVVGEASEAKEALEKAISLKPDLVLLDMYMPGLISGIEVAREINRTLSNTAVLMLGMATPSSAIEREAIDAGAIGYLQKENLDRFDRILEIIQKRVRKREESQRTNR